MYLRTHVKRIALLCRDFMHTLLVGFLIASMLLPYPLHAAFPNADGTATVWVSGGRVGNTFQFIRNPGSAAQSFATEVSLYENGGGKVEGTVPVGAASWLIKDIATNEVTTVTD